MKSRYFVFFAGSLLVPALALADVTYQETTQITGGSMMGMLKMAGAFSSSAKQAFQPTTSTVMIHGGRMVRSNPHTTEIIDLDQQTITNIDHDKRTYTTITFQELQQQMQKMTSQAKTTTAPKSSGDAPQMTFDAHITSTGATKQIDGLSANEALLTVTMSSTAADANKAGMAATTEMWSVPDAPGLAELRAFNLRMAKELAIQAQVSSMSSLLATQPGGAQALAELSKEAGKMSGFPVLQVTRVGMTADGQPLPAPSVAPLPASQNAAGGPSAASQVTSEVATSTATQTADNQIAKLGTFGRALGGSTMGSLMRHAQKPAAPAAAPAAAANSADAATAGVLLESKTETSGFSTASVDPTGLAIPAGYKQVSSPLDRK